MIHFLDIEQLSKFEIEFLIEQAFNFKNSNNYPMYRNQAVANLFYEKSTRTRVSFELAATNLGMPVVHINPEDSSETKGECVEDTIANLSAMGVNLFVIRHSQNNIHQQLAHHVANGIHIINAGSGTHAHPSQALLDLMTIIENKPQIDQLKIVIIGDIIHSRVANSFQCIAKKMGVKELVLVAPEMWQMPQALYGCSSNSLNESLDGADVIMCLRVQKERLQSSAELNLDAYRTDFAITEKNIIHAKPDVMIMHPGPMNRGVEIDSCIADGPHSYVLKQVQNSVYARMAIFDALIAN